MMQTQVVDQKSFCIKHLGAVLPDDGQSSCKWKHVILAMMMGMKTRQYYGSFGYHDIYRH